MLVLALFFLKTSCFPLLVFLCLFTEVGASFRLHYTVTQTCGSLSSVKGVCDIVWFLPVLCVVCADIQHGVKVEFEA